ncbi:DUF4259 domain-containing protein [Streptomyces sp. NRRL B-1347]|uniref:DUF4259 domain-containing protein n=1 Tax=Streptomyces sp. NRRL B-1347 TaxID=1476877 RepID=UPI00068DF4CB|nr:DUF4259 domain-containing protein [Streptomyces sp. NRRL B-1347]
MGTWGTGPLDSDTAADFVGALCGLTPQQTVRVLEDTLQQAARPGALVDAVAGAEAGAAAAVMAAALPGSDVLIDPEDAPEQPLPRLPDPLYPLAVQALHHVLSDQSARGRGRGGRSGGRQAAAKVVSPLRARAASGTGGRGAQWRETRQPGPAATAHGR